MIPKQRRPVSPGEVLQEEFLKPLELTQTALAERMNVPIQRINTLINGKRGVTAETALLLAKIFDTTPQFWMNLQTNCDLWDAQQKLTAAG
jgi:addiction module HigA family antidote